LKVEKHIIKIIDDTPQSWICILVVRNLSTRT